MARFPKFQTLNDAVLESMVIAAAEFEGKFSNEQYPFKPCWLSFVGTSGTGKTFLANSIYTWAATCPHLTFHKTLLSGISKRFWPKLVTRLRDGEYWAIDDLSESNFVFLDEIAVEHDPSGFAKDKLCELLSRRVGKWTLLTSNLNLEKLGEMDARIPSRMIRDGSVVVDCSTTDFALRETQTTNQ